MIAFFTRGGGRAARMPARLLALVHGRTLRRRSDLNYASLAALLGVSSSTEQNWREGKTSPSIDYVASVLRRRTTPDDYVLDVLQTLAGDRAVVTLVERPAGGIADQAEALRERAIEFQREALEASAEVNDALRDGRIDDDEAGRLSVRGGVLSRLASGFVTAVQRCANGGRR